MSSEDRAATQREARLAAMSTEDKTIALAAMSPADREASLKCMSPKVRAAMTRALAPATGNDQPSSQKAFCALLAGLRPDLFQATASKNYASYKGKLRHI